MNINDLLWIPSNQIDYTSLDNAALFDLATQKEEPFIATDALGEAASRRIPEAQAAAASILAGEPWDRYLYAYAITILYNREARGADW